MVVIIINTGFVTICKVSDSTKMEVEGKIVEVSTKAEVDNAEKVLIGALSSGVEDIEDVANNTDTDKVVTIRGFEVKLGK